MLADDVVANPNPISSKTDTLPKAFAVDPPAQDRLRKMFDDSRDSSQSNRLLCQQDRDYYDGPRQLKSDVRRIMKMRGQPPIYTNRIRPAIDGILGVLEAAKVDPRGYPRNPSQEDEDAADLGTKCLRYIADVSNFQQTKLDCAENFLIEGTAANIIEADGENITNTQIRWEEFFADPYSRRPDFKDAKYLGIAKWMDAADLKARNPEAYARMGDPVAGGQGALESTWQDRPDNIKPWIDRQRMRLMVVEIYYNEVKPPYANAQWFRCLYCAAGVIEHDLSAYKNPKTGETLCPIEAVSCYVDRENNRYGRIRDMIPIQDEINARRSRLLHLANSRQVQQSDPMAAPVDATVARSEAARADGVIPPGWQLVPTTDLAAGQQLLLAESKSEIERMGPTPAVLGRQGEASQSGRARLVLQQAGMTELARPLGRLEDWENRCYRQMWFRAQQFWTGPMWIRITDDVKAPDFLKINEPVMGMVMQPQPAAGPDGQPMLDPATGQPAMQMVPAVGVTGYKKRIAEIDMDIIIDTVPDTANLQQEIFAEFVELVRGGLDPFSPQFEILIEMSPIADKSKVLERLKAKKDELEQANAQQAQAAAEAQQEAMEIAAAAEKAKVSKTIAETGKTQAQTAEIAFNMGQNSAGEPPQEAAAEG